MMEQSEFEEQIRALISAATPERTSELQALWDKYSPNFQVVADEPGWLLEAGCWRIRLTPATLHRIWLSGFTLWRAVQAYAGPLWLIDRCRWPLDFQLLQDAPGQLEADAAYDDAVQNIQNFKTNGEGFLWPSDIPRPGDEEALSLQGRGVVQILKVALACIVLHEIRHLMFAQDGDAPPNAHEQELCCDQYARAFVLERVPELAYMYGEGVTAVLDKRAMGAALANFVVIRQTDAGKRGASRSHPSVYERTTAMLDDSLCGGAKWFWPQMAALLLCELRSLGPVPSQQIEFRDLPELCRMLIVAIINAAYLINDDQRTNSASG